MASSSSFDGKILRKKSMLEKFRANVLKEARKGFFCWCSVCETIKDYKGPWTSTVGLYFKGAYDVISATMATPQVHRKALFLFLCWKAPLILYLFRQHEKKNLVEFNIFTKKNAFHGLQKIVVDKFPRNFFIWSAIVNGACMQKLKMGHRTKFRARNKCFPQILFPVRAILRKM